MQPELELTHRDRGFLAAMVSHEGFSVQQRIIKAKVDAFIVNLMNADPANKLDVLTKHMMAKVAAQLYAMAVQAINEEVSQYTAAPKSSDQPQDMTEHLLDIDELQLPSDGYEQDDLLGGRG